MHCKNKEMAMIWGHHFQIFPNFLLNSFQYDPISHSLNIKIQDFCWSSILMGISVIKNRFFPGNLISSVLQYVSFRKFGSWWYSPHLFDVPVFGSSLQSFVLMSLLYLWQRNFLIFSNLLVFFLKNLECKVCAVH